MWGGDVYTHEGKNIIGISGFKNHFGIWFFNGVFINDHQNVFINAQEEKTNAMLQWRMTSIEDIDEKTLLDYIFQAIKNEEAGIRWTPKKSEKKQVSGLLAETLKKDKAFRTCFEALTPSKQKEYIEHVTSAKKVETQQARIDKIKPLVLEGKGLNDKYKK
jgi:uncharacterized protein YdeI (YjbR/CyaY-like superfamily)